MLSTCEWYHKFSFKLTGTIPKRKNPIILCMAQNCKGMLVKHSQKQNIMPRYKKWCATAYIIITFIHVPMHDEISFRNKFGKIALMTNKHETKQPSTRPDKDRPLPVIIEDIIPLQTYSYECSKLFDSFRGRTWHTPIATNFFKMKIVVLHSILPKPKMCTNTPCDKLCW